MELLSLRHSTKRKGRAGRLSNTFQLANHSHLSPSSPGSRGCSSDKLASYEHLATEWIFHQPLPWFIQLSDPSLPITPGGGFTRSVGKPCFSLTWVSPDPNMVCGLCQDCHHHHGHPSLSASLQGTHSFTGMISFPPP